MNSKTLVTGAVVGILVYGGIYFLIPRPQAVQANGCADYDDVKRAIRYCLDDTRISGGKISTDC